MKKLVLVLLGILLSVYILLSLISLGDGYHAERGLWKIDHQLDFIATHLESTPDYTVDRLANKYRDFINQYSKTIYSKRAQLALGDLYSLKKNYTQARLEYQKAICPDKELSAQAEYTIAKTYELEGNWDKALETYKYVIHTYPTTYAGFFVPIYLTSHAVAPEDQYEYKKAAYREALVFYRGIAAEYPKSRLEFNALRMIAICQLNLKDWSGTVNTMSELIIKYPIGKILRESVDAINLLCVTKLHDYDKAIGIYTQFIQKYPNHPGVPTIKKMIKSLEMLKNKKLTIGTTPATTAK